MDTLSYKTISANKKTYEKNWLLVDAEGKTLGRLASQIANFVRGKHKPSFTPHADCGDHVIVLNAEKVQLSGLKSDSKTYVHHTGYPGGQRHTSFVDLHKKDPRRIVEYAVKGMIPKTKLGRAQFKNLHVFEGTEHPHAAQKPVKID